MEQLNIRLFTLINSMARANIFFDTFMIACAVAFPYIYIAALVWLFFHKRRDARRAPAVYAAFAGISGLSINHLIGLVYFHPRPFMSRLGVQLIPHAPNTSFPSNHATFLFSIACMLLFFKSTRLIGAFMAAGALLCGAARIFCGVHFPLDILGSIVVACAVSTLLFIIQRKLSGQSTSKAP
jgi:undecaprenyl-diphosphatase